MISENLCVLSLCGSTTKPFLLRWLWFCIYQKLLTYLAGIVRLVLRLSQLILLYRIHHIKLLTLREFGRLLHWLILRLLFINRYFLFFNFFSRFNNLPTLVYLDSFFVGVVRSLKLLEIFEVLSVILSPLQNSFLLLLNFSFLPQGLFLLPLRLLHPFYIFLFQGLSPSQLVESGLQKGVSPPQDHKVISNKYVLLPKHTFNESHHFDHFNDLFLRLNAQNFVFDDLIIDLDGSILWL